MSTSNTSGKVGALGGVIGVLVMLGIVIAANAIVSRMSGMRADLTEEKLFTLSDGTQQLLKEMPREVTLKFFFSQSLENTPPRLKSYGNRVMDLLQEYKAAGSGRVKLEVYDPKPFSDAEERAGKYGVEGQLVGMGGEEFFLGVVATAGTSESLIPFIHPNVEPQLEYQLTRLISETATKDKPKLGVLSGLPVMGAGNLPPQLQMQMGRNAPRKWIFVTELEKQFDVLEVNASVEEVDPDIGTLIVVHPKGFSDKTLYAIDQFVMRGGRLIALLDPMCQAEQAVTPQQNNQFGMFGNSSDLNKLTKPWGIELRAGKVTGDKNAASMVSRGRGSRPERMLSYLHLTPDLMDREDAATASLENVVMPFAGSFTGEPAAGLKMTVLAKTSDASGTLDTFQAFGAAAQVIKDMAPSNNMPLALRLRGKFKSAFPDGAPADSPGDDAPPAPPPPGIHLKEAEKESVVVLIADVDFVYDPVAVNTIQLPGYMIVEPMNDNLNLLVNLTEQAAGNPLLIGLRSRGTFSRPFTTVDELAKSAQDKWQAKEQEVQDKLQDAQRKLSELQTKKSADKRMILSDEQREEIKKFRLTQIEARKELKEVQKNLSQDIDALGVMVKVLNIFALPAAIALFGIFIGLVRRFGQPRSA